MAWIWIVKGLGVVLLADFVSGAVHWWEDAYARTTGWMRQVAIANLRHHARPREFVAHSYLESNWDLLLLGALVVAGAAWCSALSGYVVLFAALVAHGNQIHKFAHCTPAENGPLVATLQRLRILQTPRHHARHHLERRDSHYCVITNLLNPVLEAAGFWRRAERAVGAVTGLRPRDEAAELARLGLATGRGARP